MMSVKKKMDSACVVMSTVAAARGAVSDVKSCPYPTDYSDWPPIRRPKSIQE
jgi:hypothetical protein